MGLDADGDAHQHVLHHAHFTGDRVEPLDLDHRVEHHVADARTHSARQFVD